MTPRLDAVALVVADLDRSLDFYRRLGVPVPADAEPPHVEAELGGGVRIMWDLPSVPWRGTGRAGDVSRRVRVARTGTN
jgi:catechol 2,3-dioxygenase-like lactoylglutathione lyase family enzyme